MKQILQGLFTFSTLTVGRVYLIEDADGYTLIDASTRSAPLKMAKEMRDAGKRMDHVRRILITHAHYDHVDGLRELHEMTGAQVWAHPLEKPVIEGKALEQRPEKSALGFFSKLLWSAPKLRVGVEVNRTIDEGDILDDVMGGLHVVHTPGHAPGAISFWQPSWRVLICGDVMMNIPKLSLPFAAYTVDMAQNIQSIKRLAKLQPAIVCFGHGQPLRFNPAAKLNAFVATLK